LISTHQVEVVAQTTSISMALSLVERHNPDFLFLSVEPDTIAFIEKIRNRNAGMKIIAVGLKSDPELILQCFRSGADEYAERPLQADEVVEALARMQSRSPLPALQSTRQGRVLGFWGSRGGCGTTTIAWNVAHELNQSRPTALVDLHFGQGDLAFHLDVQPTFSLREIGDADGRCDDTLMESITLKHASGLRLLLQPADGQPCGLREETIQALLENLRKRYAYVVLDLGHDFDPVVAALPLVNDLFLVVTQEIPSLALAAQKNRRLNEIGIHPPSLRLVVNAFTNRSSVTLGHIAKALGQKDAILVREDKRKAQSAVNRGIPLRDISRRGAAKDLSRLSDSILKSSFASGTMADSEPAVVRFPVEKTAASAAH